LSIYDIHQVLLTGEQITTNSCLCRINAMNLVYTRKFLVLIANPG